ncbi:MAG: uberolysin/carnocyclin family circular bacteriocin [Christensenellales bacterium]
MKNKATEETVNKKPSKIKSIFAILYFATTVASLLFYTATAIKDVVKDGWSPINIVMVAFIGLSYLILIACIVLSKNVAGAKATHAKAKKLLKLGKKVIKIVHAVPTVMILFATTPVDFLDFVSRAFSIISLVMHVIGLITSINMIITKLVVKKVAKKGKEKISAKIASFKNSGEESEQEVLPLADNDEQ